LSDKTGKELEEPRDTPKAHMKTDYYVEFGDSKVELETTVEKMPEGWFELSLLRWLITYFFLGRKCNLF
jgi:hypothetical protein